MRVLGAKIFLRSVKFYLVLTFTQPVINSCFNYLNTETTVPFFPSDLLLHLSIDEKLFKQHPPCAYVQNEDDQSVCFRYYYFKSRFISTSTLCTYHEFSETEANKIGFMGYLSIFSPKKMPLFNFMVKTVEVLCLMK